MTEVMLEMGIESAHRNRQDFAHRVQMPTTSTLRT